MDDDTYVFCPVCNGVPEKKMWVSQGGCERYAGKTSCKFCKNSGMVTEAKRKMYESARKINISTATDTHNFITQLKLLIDVRKERKSRRTKNTQTIAKTTSKQINKGGKICKI